MSVRHLYVHLPFCRHRCGYCDFVTVVGRDSEHDRYVDALLRELELERRVVAAGVETVFLGGGTPTLLEPGALARLLAALPPAQEVTVEANPETVTPELAALLAEGGVTRVSLGAQSFTPRLLGSSSARRGPTTSALRSTLFAMAVSTTSRSISSTGFPARAPPTSTATSTRRSSSGRITSRATSSKRSRGRASPIPSGLSSSARGRPWRATSSRSSSG